MKKKINIAEKKFPKQPIHGFSIALLIQSILSILWLLLIPKELSNVDFLGYSYRRLALLFPLLLPVLGAIFVYFQFNKSATWRKWIESKRKKANLAKLLIISGLLLAIIGWSFIFINHFLNLIKDIGKYERLMPILVLYIFIGVEFLLLVVTAFYPIVKNKFKYFQLNRKSFLFALLIIGLFFLLFFLTGWGQGSTRIVIVSLGVPLLEGQIWYVIGLCLLVSLAAVAWSAIPSDYRSLTPKHIDLFLFLALWLIAVLLWSSLQLPEHNYFAPSARLPNFEKYPFSDAEQYDYNSLYVLFGTAENFVVSKPLYVSFLAVLHAIAGFDYARVVFFQTLIIALFPGVVFLIGKELHNRLSGIAIGLLVIFREINSIQASTMANVSNSKLLLSGMLAALIVSLMVYTIIRWFKKGEDIPSVHPFILGGLMGALILTRIQAMVLVPFGILLAIVRYFKNIKSIIISILLLLLAVSLVLAPVLARNHSITGVYWVDNPSSSGGLYKYFIVEDDYGIEIPEADTVGEELKRNIAVITTAFSRGFGEIVQFVMDHLIRNEISSMLIMPVRLGNDIQFLDFLKITKPFWSETYTQDNLLNFLVFILNSAIIALGFSIVFDRNPWMALSVIGLHLIYSLSSAIVRIAGWRFILPVDWVILLFYTLGVTELVCVFFQFTVGWNIKTLAPIWTEFTEIGGAKHNFWKKILFSGLIMILVGGFIPLREILFKRSVQTINREEICSLFISKAESVLTPEKKEKLDLYCKNESTVAYMGHGIYPRLFKEGEGYYDRPEDARFGIQDYSRLVFRLIGQPNWSGYIKTNREDINFPNGAYVLVLDQDLNEGGADYVLVAEEEMDLIISEPTLTTIE